MTKVNLTIELILSINSSSSDELCKSRFFSGSYINSKNGLLFNKRLALSYLAANTRLEVIRKESWKYVGKSKIEDAKALKEALRNLDYLSADSLEWLNKEFKPWIFFNEELKAGEPTNCLELYGDFFPVKSCTEKTFYQELKFWAAENQYQLTFKNRGVKRKVILEL